MNDSNEEKFAGWIETLERAYGKGAFVSKRWLRNELVRRAMSATRAGSVATATAPIASAAPTESTQKSALKAGIESLEQIRQDLGDCRRCKLCEKRKNIVFGEGNPKAKLLFIGEGPGEQEDQQGRPFVGAAGQLLDKIIEAMGLKRGDVYIANVVKCRPPGNRAPEIDESGACEPFLFRQIETINPAVMVALGGTALKCLFGEEARITKMRGRFIEFRGRKLMPTFHPAYLLRTPEAKREVWEDMKKVKAELGMK